jgi:hypothetical protein
LRWGRGPGKEEAARQAAGTRSGTLANVSAADPAAITAEKEAPMASHSCETCKLRKKAEEKPDSLIARFWRWHTKWCPGWKAYQKSLAKEG